MKLYVDHIKRWSLVVFSAALIACAGCSDDIGLNGNDGGDDTTPSDFLAFTVRLSSENVSSSSRSAVANIGIVEEQWGCQAERDGGSASRGALTNHLGGEAGVLGFQYDDENDKTPIAGGDNNLECEFDGNQLVAKDATILWETITQKHLNVYAYAPYVSSMTATDSMKLDFATAPPEINYIVPDLIANQKDILVARWISKEQKDSENFKNKTIPLVFNHALTAVRFKVAFACKVKSVEIRNVYNHGEYDFLQEEWTIIGQPQAVRSDGSISSCHTYKLSFSNEYHEYEEFGNEGPEFLTLEDEYMILMPQTLPKDAEIVLTCKEKDENGDEQDKEYSVNIGDKVWEPGKLITYTFYQGQAPETIYFDLAAGCVTINGSTYTGYVYKGGGENPVTVSGAHKTGNHYYVYQSTAANRAAIWNGDVCRPPEYTNITAPDGRPWREFITNNTNVESVIDVWHKDHDQIAKNVGRSGTENWININGSVTCDLTIDNIYSIYQNGNKDPNFRLTAGITFVPTGNNAKLTVNMVGDNRLGAVHYYNPYKGNEIIFEGTGSLTVADVDGIKKGLSDNGNCGLDHNEGKGYWSNFWSSAIGGCDDGRQEICHGIVINSGIIFAGTTKAENCTAIGGGGNAYGEVTINGGTVTAVATTTGTAIGGGIGFNSQGGKGKVEITGGNVYAYNHANRWNIPSSAIGGAGSRSNYGEEGTVIISGGYVYAESALGTAIGGGSSQSRYGGDANITISGGEVFAKTGSRMSASIGGGTGCSNPAEANKNNYNHNGGNANITIYGNPIIRTGSIGGGGTGDSEDYIGNATIHIYGGDIQGQFLLSAGTGKGEIPSFEMTGGTIRNSNTADEEYLHVKPDGGAVYLENGTVTISGGEIRNCKANRGGAIYIEGSSKDGVASNASFIMSGGFIEDNEAIGVDVDNIGQGGGGAVYIIDGKVEMTGGTISDNMAAGGNGGGIFIRRGSLTVNGKDAVIKGNTSEIRRNGDAFAGGNGGGIYVYSNSQNVDVDVKLLSGKIIENTADRRGGGLCVIQDNKERKALITVGTQGADNFNLQIIRNHTLLQGGGVYAKGANAHIIINSGTIQDNTVSQYVHNEDVANDLGSVTLNGGDVKHNDVTFNINDGSDNPETSIQKIVTETNSVLITPKFTRMGFTLVGWNTKPSGAGESYAEGDIMKINKDITLYAQWKAW